MFGRARHRAWTALRPPPRTPGNAPCLTPSANKPTGQKRDQTIKVQITPGHSDNINFFGVINVDVEAELAKLDTNGWRPLRPAQLRELGLTP
ncbi:hypothetical protein AB0J28_12370 [Streptosporangium canum]|uniref:hypothetical protein n=1 Tax=Streptosporangium canum TaxID=324952 RepID=UPI00343E353E